MGKFILTVLKVILAILLIPIVIACSIVFYKHLTFYPSGYKEFFIWGALSFLLAFLFIYQFWSLHELGQKAGRGLFRLLAPADIVLARMLPFFSVIIFISFYIIKRILHFDNYDHYFIYFAGFIFAMNILLVAQELQNEETSAFKPNYFFWMGITFVMNIIFVVLLMDLVVWKFTFMRFFWASVEEARKIYTMCLSVKFIVKIAK